MSDTAIPRGYLINQYQYARRYRYNSSGCIFYFNKMLNEHPHPKRDFLAFGDFDLLEFIKVNTFREYYDVSTKAKQWLGKRQSVLLYDISQPIGAEYKEFVKPEIYNQRIATTMLYNENKESWVSAANPEAPLDGRFICLSMLSITNEINQHFPGTIFLLKLLRLQIHELLSKINSTLQTHIHCEVFGSFNAAELGIVFVSDEYVDAIRLLDSIKHIKVRDSTGNEHPVFLNCFSTIGFRDDLAAKIEHLTVKGRARVQVAIHDLTDSHDKLKELACKIVEADDDSKVFFSVGEYDFVVEVSAKRAIQLISPEGELAIATKNPDGKSFQDIPREILRSNIRLLYSTDDVTALDNKLNELKKDGYFVIMIESVFDTSKTVPFEKDELIDDKNVSCKTLGNETYYIKIREALKKRICSSAGAVDTLDMLYTDYKSVLTGAYNATWVSDLHRQFKSILHAINLMIESKDMEWDWSDFHDVTNAFKQQTYHLSQSSRHFFDVPSCHLRSTGQYDFLMHTCYGITKKIIEIIYRLQCTDSQSELVPFITVNTVPQVTTELFFEVGSNSGMRTINLNIPNSIIFNPHRCIGYLTHELFHYAVPIDRNERNYRLALLYLTQIFKFQVLHELKDLLITGMDLEADNTLEQIFISKDDVFNGMHSFSVKLLSISLPDAVDANLTMGIEEFILELISRHYDDCVYKHIMHAHGGIRNKFEAAVLQFAYEEKSNNLFTLIFKQCFENLYVNAEKLKEKLGKNLSKLTRNFLQRLEYCKNNTEKFNTYVSEIEKKRVLSKSAKLNMNQKSDFNYILEPCRTSLNEACADVAMISLNNMTLTDYLVFCVQNMKDRFESANNDSLLSIMEQEHEQKLKIAMVTEYFYNKATRGWELQKRHRHNITLTEEAEKDFRRIYTWFYIPGRITNPKQTLADELKNSGLSYRWVCAEDERRLQNEATGWIQFFTECFYYFKRDYAVYCDDCFTPVLDNYNVCLRLDKLTDTTPKTLQSKEAVVKAIDTFQTIQDNYKNLLKILPDLSVFVSSLPEDASQISHGTHCGSYGDFTDAFFAQNIAVADSFQRQYTLAELGSINNTVRSSLLRTRTKWSPKVPDKFTDKPCTVIPEKNTANETEFTVKSLNELMFYLRYCSTQLKNNAQKCGVKTKDFLWFRGHSSTEYKMLPSIIRKYNNQKQSCYQSLRNYQLGEYEEFKFRADGASEMPTGVRFTHSDYIALMQHYAVPTNFLDWTENVATSLYFALESHFDYRDKKILAAKGYDRDAALYIFSPGLYNYLRNEKIKKALLNIHSDDGNKYKSYFPKELSHINTIPNLSTNHNEKLLSMYILGSEEFDEFWRKEVFDIGKSAEDIFKSEPYLKQLCLPMAVWTSRLNSRIKTQSGCFVAFNLYCPPIQSENDDSPFNYCDLQQIQKEYFNEINHEFLYKIIINKSCCEEIVQWLKATGISRENIYPELERLKERFE